MRKRSSTTCVLALTLLVLGTGSAQATTMTEYDVTVEGQATYARNDAFPAPFGQWEHRAKAAFTWRTRFPSVTFIGKQVSMTSVLPQTAVTDVAAESFASVPTSEGPLTRTCTGNAVAGSPGTGWFGSDVVPTPDPRVESLAVRTLGNVGFQLPSCTGRLAGGPDSFSIGSMDEEIGFGPFDDAFDMPHEAIGMGKIIQLLDATVTGRRCPGFGDGTASCTLAWKATVTFVRIAQRELGPGGTPPPGGAPPQGGEQPKGGSSDPDDCVIPMPDPDPACLDPDDLVPMPPTRGRLSRDASRATLTVTCGVACSGAATAYLARRGAHASVARPLARARFSGAPGRRAHVVLRFRPQARRAILRAGAVRIEVRVAARTGGTTLRRTVTAQLSRASR